jgi:hypothetical protein
MKKALLLCALGTALLGSQVAKADTFSFTFIGTVPLNLAGLTFSGTGYFTANQIGSSDNYQITDVYNGSVVASDGITSDIAGIIGVGGFQGNDNILIFPPELFGTKFFDHGGVSFSLEDGIDINLNDTVGFENAVAGAGPFDFTELDIVDVDRAPAPAPEPGSLALLGTSILGGAGILRRRFRA